MIRVYAFTGPVVGYRSSLRSEGDEDDVMGGAASGGRSEETAERSENS
jgi:hypothetical protein